MVEFSILEMLGQASLLVQGVMLILVLASFVSWVIIFNKSQILRRQHQEAIKFEDKFWQGIELVQFYDQMRQRQSRPPLGDVFCAGFREYVQLVRNKQLSPDTISHTAERSMRVVLTREAEHLEVHLPVLATIGSTSPYIGLFGTVWGIINAFHSLDPTRGASMLTMIAPGISEALVATALGLFAAIPAVIAYNRFTDRVDKLLTQYSNFIEEFTTLLQREALANQEKP